MFRTKYRYAFILLLAVYSFFNIQFFVGDKLFDFSVPALVLFCALLTSVLVIWEIDRLIILALEKSSLGILSKIHRLITVFILSQLSSVIASITGVTVVYFFISDQVSLNIDHYKLMAAFCFRVNLFLNCVNAIWYFMDKSRNAELQAEQFKKATIEAQFEALRNQINPHFLFNCLNALSNLVYKDAETSAKFIGQLSSVYRYLLYNQEKKVVSLRDEMEFIEAYLFLVKIRFGNNIFIIQNITADLERFQIAPATIQLLIENAIKHNVVSVKLPLTIQISSVNGSISVCNTLQVKPVKEPSANIGLNNIIKRYEFLSDKPVVITKTVNEFCVSVPLVKIE